MCIQKDLIRFLGVHIERTQKTFPQSVRFSLENQNYEAALHAANKWMGSQQSFEERTVCQTLQHYLSLMVGARCKDDRKYAEMSARRVLMSAALRLEFLYHQYAALRLS